MAGPGREGLTQLRAELRTQQKREQEVRAQLEAKEKQAAELQVCCHRCCLASCRMGDRTSASCAFDWLAAVGVKGPPL